MQVAGCLNILCLFVFLEYSAGECPRTRWKDVSLECEPTVEVSSGHILIIGCVVVFWEDLLGRGCEAVGSPWPDCRCAGEPCDCDLWLSSRRNRRTYNRNVDVVIHNVTVAGNYTVSMTTTCGQAVSNTIKINIRQPRIRPRGVFLQCEPPAHELVSGQNLTVHCFLKNSGFRRLKPCEAKGSPGLTCLCSGEPCDCELKTIPNRSYINWIQNTTVEVYNVTNTGIYNVSMETTCGMAVQDSFKVNVTTPLTN